MRAGSNFGMIAKVTGVGLILAIGASPISAKLPKRLVAMTPAAFAAAVTVDEDPLEPQLVLSTEKAFVARSMGQKIFDDNHIRAVIDKRSGATRYEIHQSMRYWGDRRNFQTVHYQTAEGLTKAPLTLARHGGDICPNEEVMTPCALTKRVVFEIDERVLQTIAARYTPGSGDGWAYKLKDRNGADWTDAIAPAEAAGLLQAVQRYRGGHS